MDDEERQGIAAEARIKILERQRNAALSEAIIVGGNLAAALKEIEMLKAALEGKDDE